MTSRAKGEAMRIKQVVPIIPVTDIKEAMEFYCSTLGFGEDFSYPARPAASLYAGLSLDGHQIHLSAFETAAGRAATYFYLDDVDALFERLRRNGYKTPGNPDSPVEEGPVNQTWGMREFYVRDRDGNTLIFGSPVEEAD